MTVFPPDHNHLPTSSPLGTLLSVGLAAGALIALQVAIMRIFAVGGWAHFGSLVVGLAMLGFGLASVILSIRRKWFEAHWRAASSVSIFAIGPLTVLSNLAAQMVPFNAIFLVSDANQIWRLVANLALFLMPFLAGAFFLGIVFLKSGKTFGRAYFADLVGSGVASILVLGASYVLPPERLLSLPLLLWGAGCMVWFGARDERRSLWGAVAIAILSVVAYNTLPAATGIPDIAVSQYKGVAYARNFPDARRVYRNISPFGDLQVYASSYMHFAPGLSDNAAFNIPDVPPDTYVGMYVDGDGPEGIMRTLPPADSAYFRYLPVYYPYVVKAAPKTFVVQFGGGISTATALSAGAASVTVAESNPEVLAAFRDASLEAETGDILADPRVHVIAFDGRLFLAHTEERYDVIDLSLADSTGLSNPGGFSITEKYAYTVEAVETYLRALSKGGVLAVTVWNKEEPPKSIMKLYSTLAQAIETVDPDGASQSLFVTSTYLSTTTLLYKKGGFSAGEVELLRRHTASMSFDEIYSPGMPFDGEAAKGLLAQYQNSIFGSGGSDGSQPASTSSPPDDPSGTQDVVAAALPSTTLERLFWHSEFFGGSDQLSDHYVFDLRPLTNDRPYFAAYVKPGDLLRTLDRLDLFQDDWGYLLLWATFGLALSSAASLVVLPLIFGWRAAFSRSPGKFASIVFFAAIGIGYIVVEVGLISRFNVALTNPTISASLLIGGMLFFSGLGSLVADRMGERAEALLPIVLASIGSILIAYGLALDPVLEVIGASNYGLRLAMCFTLTAPPAFLMGFPMSTAMAAIARLERQQIFVWAWGVNGCFSVVGAAAVPLVATSFGLSAVLLSSAGAYLVAIPAFLSIMKKPRASASDQTSHTTHTGTPA